MTHILILICLIFVLLWIIYCHNIEHLTPIEAVSNIASLYNNELLTTSNINVTNKLTAQTISGGTITANQLSINDVATANQLVINGLTTTNQLTVNNQSSLNGGINTNTIATNKITGHGSLTIGDGGTDLITQKKVYQMNGNPTGGDIAHFSGITQNQALTLCKNSAICDRVAFDGTTYWLKNTNDYSCLLGSLDWTDDVIFTGTIANLPSCINGYTSQEQCMQLANNNGKRNWLWSPVSTGCCTWNNNDNFYGSNVVTYHIPKL